MKFLTIASTFAAFAVASISAAPHKSNLRKLQAEGSFLEDLDAVDSERSADESFLQAKPEDPGCRNGDLRCFCRNGSRCRTTAQCERRPGYAGGSCSSRPPNREGNLSCRNGESCINNNTACRDGSACRERNQPTPRPTPRPTPMPTPAQNKTCRDGSRCTSDQQCANRNLNGGCIFRAPNRNSNKSCRNGEKCIKNNTACADGTACKVRNGFLASA